MPFHPNMTLAAKRLIRDMAKRIPELAHVRPSRVLVVVGEARRASRATIRGIALSGSGRAGIVVRGRPILYVITLRPPWFLGSQPAQRIGTVLHELYHTSTRFDGTLHQKRRHRELGQGVYGRRIRVLLEEYLDQAPEAVLAPFSRTGLARVRMWLERPTWRARQGGRDVYTEKQLFYALMPMRTSPAPGSKGGEPAKISPYVTFSHAPPGGRSSIRKRSRK